MLGKLMKYEWKSTCRVGTLMVLLTVLVTFLGWLSFKSPMWRQIMGDGNYYRFSAMDVLSLVSLFAWIFMLIGITYGLLIYVAVHFYKTMYTDQGYLTHTLPVGRHQLLASKILINGIWVLIVDLLVILSAVIVTGSLVAAAVPEGYSLWEFLRESGISLKQIIQELNSTFGINIYNGLIYLAVSLLVSPFAAVTTIFGAITVGQLFSRGRIAMAIVCYVCINIISGMTGSLVQTILSYGNAGAEAYMNVSLNSSFVVSIVIAAVLYVISYVIISRKLNME